MYRYATGAFLIATLVCFAASAAGAQERPRLETHESYVDEVMRTTTLAIDDPMAVFEFVFNSLPDRVNVYPTENYYYFTFMQNAKSYDGNIRLDASTRDDGKMDFAYSEELKEWIPETPVSHLLLDAAKGVVVEKVERFVYRVIYKQKSVLFVLNDLSQVKPPAGAIGPNETFVGPIFDDSAVRFLLVFNSKLKIFHYILDETVDNRDPLIASSRIDRILIGKRSGFAYYRDHSLPRKILIGVFQGNIWVNNHFDGPFDQLPDNFLEGDTLRKMILEVAPDMKGKMDRFGGSPDGSQRFAIAPYVEYRKESDLDKIHRCATRAERSASYYNCFVTDYSDEFGAHYRPRSRALQASKAGRPGHR
jgi:hypothetical protein